MLARRGLGLRLRLLRGCDFSRSRGEEAGCGVVVSAEVQAVSRIMPMIKNRFMIWSLLCVIASRHFCGEAISQRCLNLRRLLRSLTLARNDAVNLLEQEVGVRDFGHGHGLRVQICARRV